MTLNIRMDLGIVMVFSIRPGHSHQHGPDCGIAHGLQDINMDSGNSTEDILMTFGGNLAINRDLGCSRVSDPDIALGRNTDQDISMTGHLHQYGPLRQQNQRTSSRL
ncbi:hypothetical protein H671_5g15182 [Cricetulus griseus]|uniref:Uncharacterized protein n=1 Tax=Cricetulus griseus TaxID=10029 RepID=A0A061I1V5_CRIGR|nr:hypothetical protein H671_5g15182 [Cricetulus griseus]